MSGCLLSQIDEPPKPSAIKELQAIEVDDARLRQVAIEFGDLLMEDRGATEVKLTLEVEDCLDAVTAKIYTE